jgi:hypothetical protein
MIIANVIIDLDEFDKTRDFSVVKLTEHSAIESEFLKILQSHKNAFWDELSIKILKEVDESERVGDYGVKTWLGNSCITCLATGIKLALIIFFYKENFPNVRVITRTYCAGENIWKFMSDNSDVELYLNEKNIENLIMMNQRDFKYKLNDEEISYSKLLRKIENIESEKLLFTKEREAVAYKNYPNKTEHTNSFDRILCEKMSLFDFAMSLNSEKMEDDLEDCKEYAYQYPYTMEEIERWKQYTLVNYCSKLSEWYDEYHDVYMVEESADKNTFKKRDRCFFTLLDFLLKDIFETGGKNCCYIVIYTDKFKSADKYTDAVVIGIYIDNEKREVDILDKPRAIKRLHELIQSEKTIIETDTLN